MRACRCILSLCNLEAFFHPCPGSKYENKCTSGKAQAYRWRYTATGLKVLLMPAQEAAKKILRCCHNDYVWVRNWHSWPMKTYLYPTGPHGIFPRENEKTCGPLTWKLHWSSFTLHIRGNLRWTKLRQPAPCFWAQSSASCTDMRNDLTIYVFVRSCCQISVTKLQMAQSPRGASRLSQDHAKGECICELHASRSSLRLCILLSCGQRNPMLMPIFMRD